MPYLFVYQWYPAHKTLDVVKKSLEMLPNFPQDESLGTQIIQTAVNTDKKGVKTLSAWEVNEGKLDALITRIAPFYAGLHGIEGFGYSIETWMTITEAMSAIGQKMPE